MIVEPRYRDGRGEWHDVHPDTLRMARELVDEHPPNADAYEVANAAPRYARRGVVPLERRVGLREGSAGGNPVGNAVRPDRRIVQEIARRRAVVRARVADYLVEARYRAEQFADLRSAEALGV